MILTIDIGNSSTKFGVFENETLINKITIPTKRDETSESIFKQIRTKIPQTIVSILVSTVVKELKETYIKLGQVHFNKTPSFADYTLDFGFEIKYFPPKDCGSDRLVGAFAATQKYGNPVIVCDIGTATNFEVVNAKNQYIGGIITPGPNTLSSALFEKTSKLPKVKFEKPQNVIGNSTVSSIQSGIYFGYVSLIDGIIEKTLKELEIESANIISTGGFAKLIAKESKFLDITEENLILEGLRLVHKKINRE